MENILIKREGGRQCAYPTASQVRVLSHLGTGDLRYVTDDGRAGVHLDNDADERRVDEIAIDRVRQIHRIGERNGLRIDDLVAAIAHTPAPVVIFAVVVL
jgi:hypothetical protein